MAYLTISNLRLYVEVFNEHSTKGTMVFLNGVMASTNSWYGLMEPFMKLGYKIVLHDFKGQLKSDKPKGPYTFLEHANELIAILDKLGCEDVHLVGTSYGGEVAMKVASHYPNRVASLSIIDSTASLNPLMIRMVQTWKEAAQRKDREAFFSVLVPSLYGETFIKDNHDFLQARANAFKKIPLDYLEGQIALYDTFLNDVTMVEELPLIKAPTLVICGEHDILKTPHHSNEIHQHINHSEYVILADCGHVAIFEKPNELITLLLGFILKHDQPIEQKNP